jgi:dTDP-4-dehydrorhamnose 3,5-epimerase-like enzyme
MTDGQAGGAPELEELAIAGVVRASLPVVHYNSSTLVEAHRAGWSSIYDEPIDHLYWIVTERGVRRQWGKHDRTTDRYAVVQGTIEVALVDDREASDTRGELLVVTLDGAAGHGLRIPTGIWHTFRAVSPMAVLLNSKTPPYDPADVDKHLLAMPNDRIPFEWDD